MKENQRWIIFGTVLIAAGLLGGYGLSKSYLVPTETVKPLANAGFITGHIELVAKDKDGNIKAYRQTDNLIVNNGQNCAAKALFSLLTVTQNSGVGLCTGAVTKPFTVIAIGTGSTAANKADVGLGTESSGGGLSRSQIDTAIVWSNSTGSSTTNTNSAQVVLQKTFTLSSGSATITESGLFNDTATATGGLFARQTFTGIGLTTVGDALTVKWTVQIGGTTAFS